MSRPEPNPSSWKIWSYPRLTRGPAPTVDMRCDKKAWFYATDVISASTQNVLWKKEEQIIMGDHSFAQLVKDRLSTKASKISWKIGHCMLTSGKLPSRG